MICREEGRGRGASPPASSGALQGSESWTHEVCWHTGQPRRGPWPHGRAPHGSSEAGEAAPTPCSPPPWKPAPADPSPRKPGRYFCYPPLLFSPTVLGLSCYGDFIAVSRGPEKPEGSTYSSTSGLSPLKNSRGKWGFIPLRGSLECNPEIPAFPGEEN